MMPYDAKQRAGKRATQDVGRALIAAIREQREAATPQRITPAWAASFWRRVAT